MDELKTDLLTLEARCRAMQFEYDNRYAVAHLQEIVAFMWLALAQVKYAELALESPPDRSDDHGDN